MLDVNLEFHPAANVFPLLEGQDLKVLVDTMRERGVYDPAHPIILFEKPYPRRNAIGV